MSGSLLVTAEITNTSDFVLYLNGYIAIQPGETVTVNHPCVLLTAEQCAAKVTIAEPLPGDLPLMDVRKLFPL